MELTRRSFLGTAGLAGAAVAASSVVAAPAAAVAAEEPGRVLNPQIEDYTSYSGDVSAMFEPLQVGSLTFRNRFVKSPAGSDTWAPVDDTINENMLQYYGNFAKGGCAMVFVETAISKMISCRCNADGRTLSGWLVDDLSTTAAKLKPLSDAIHAGGAYAGMQLAAASADVATVTKEDIKWMQETMVTLCKAYQDGGMDGVELHASASQTMKYMVSARYNTRDDEYGPQSVENRTRFTCETIKMIKEACGPDFMIQVLMDAVEDNDTLIGDNDEFITIEDAIANAQAYEAAGADTFYLRLSVPGKHVSQFAPDLLFSGYKCEGLTGFGTRFDFSQHFGGMLNAEYSGTALLLKCAAELKKHVSVPVSAAGCMDPRLAPDMLNDAIRNGEIDYFMMTRALTVEPELPNLLQAGRRDEIAPCCHCLHCHAKGGLAIYTPAGGVEFCRVNAKTQLAYTDVMPEGYELLPADSCKNVVVIGGGPAGMEAARIAAQRGHKVTLVEKGAFLGGLLPVARAFKGEHERLGDLNEYLQRQLEINGVEVILGTEATAESVLAMNPDAVIVATGGKRPYAFSNTMTIDDVPAIEAEKIAVIGAGAQATDTILWLLANGKKVQAVHAGGAGDIAKEQSMWVRTYVIPQMESQGVKFWNNCSVEGIVEGGLHITTKSGVEKIIPCDAVVEINDMEPNTALAEALEGKVAEVYTVGDAVAPWNIALAIRDGNLTARKL